MDLTKRTKACKKWWKVERGWDHFSPKLSTRPKEIEYISESSKHTKKMEIRTLGCGKESSMCSLIGFGCFYLSWVIIHACHVCRLTPLSVLNTTGQDAREAWIKDFGRLWISAETSRTISSLLGLCAVQDGTCASDGSNVCQQDGCMCLWSHVACLGGDLALINIHFMRRLNSVLAPTDFLLRMLHVESCLSHPSF